jgi:hypothetical protein
VQAFVADARSAHAEETVAWTMPDPTLAQPMTSQSNARGDIVFPDRSRWVGESMFWEETVTVPEARYVRRANTESSLLMSSWTSHGPGAAPRAAIEVAYGPGGTADPAGSGLDVRHLAGLVGGLSAAEVTAAGVKATSAADAGPPPVTAELGAAVASLRPFVLADEPVSRPRQRTGR